MITVYIQSSDDVVYNRIRYVMTQLLVPIGFRFRIQRHLQENDAKFSIACVPVMEAKADLSKKYNLVIPYDEYSSWTQEDTEIKIERVEGIPVLYIGTKPRFIIHKRQVGFDLINLAFFLLARQEEYTYHHRDLQERFAAPYSILYEHGLLQIPILNDYIKHIAAYIGKSIRDTPEPAWKDGAPYAIVLSHDVDLLPLADITVPLRQIGQAFRESGFSAKTKHAWYCMKEIVSCIRSGHPTWQLSHWLDKESEYGFRSTFFFASNITSPHRADPKYWLHSKLEHKGQNQRLSRVAKFVEEMGWEVGLHGSYSTFQNQDLLHKEKEQLVSQTGCMVVGIRQHYLRFDVRKTWRIHECLGFAYDTTLGYSERNGFRAGIAFPFWPYDLQNEQAYNLIELPMSIMDGNFFVDYGEKLDAKKAIQRCKKLFEVVEQTEGLIVINFHPHYYKTTHPDWWAVYEHILEHAAESGAWVTTGREVTEWWIERRRLLIQDV